MFDKEDRIDTNECIAMQFAARGMRRDTGETAGFARELEWLQAEAIGKKCPEFKGLSLVPVIGGAVPAGARSHTYREFEGFGEAELLESMTPEDFPTADIRGEEFTGKFRHVGAKYHVSLEELKAKPSMSLDPEMQKGIIARKVVESKIDRIVWGAAATLNGPFKGLLHDDNSIDDTSSDDWTTGTEAGDVAAVLATIRRVINTQFVDTAGLFPSLDFVLSTKQFLKMNLFVPSTTVGGGTTLGSFLLQHVAGVRSISHCARLDAAGSGGKDRLLAYPRDPEVFDFLLPTRFEQTAPQLNGMVFTTFCAAKIGGFRIRHPKAMRRADVTMT